MRLTAASVAQTTAALLIVQLVIAGAAGAAVTEPSEPVCPVPGYTTLGCPVRTDPVICNSVMIRLAGLTKPPDVIEVFVRDGQVTLAGRVRDPGIRDTATILAGSVWGIRCLSNEIAIVPVGTSDEQIVAAVSRYLGKAPLGTRQIRVQAADGVVRLTGIVSSDFVRDQAGMIAAAVQGVTAVHNNLVVQGPGESY